QRQFLRRLIEGRKKIPNAKECLTNSTKTLFTAVFTSTSQKRNCLELLRTVAIHINNTQRKKKMTDVAWHSVQNKFMSNGIYFDSLEKYKQALEEIVEGITVKLEPLEELVLRANIQLCYELLSGYVQYDHIQPLLKRIDSYLPSLIKVVAV